MMRDVILSFSMVLWFGASSAANAQADLEWDANSYAEVEELAQEATELSGMRYIGTTFNQNNFSAILDRGVLLFMSPEPVG